MLGRVSTATDGLRSEIYNMRHRSPSQILHHTICWLSYAPMGAHQCCADACLMGPQICHWLSDCRSNNSPDHYGSIKESSLQIISFLLKANISWFSNCPIHHFLTPQDIILWVNYNNSLTWILRPFGDDFPYPNYDFQGSLVVSSLYFTSDISGCHCFTEKNSRKSILVPSGSQTQRSKTPSKTMMKSIQFQKTSWRGKSWRIWHQF